MEVDSSSACSLVVTCEEDGWLWKLESAEKIGRKKKKWGVS